MNPDHDHDPAPLLAVPILERPQQFVRNSVLRVDDSEDEGASTAERQLRRCTIHEVVDRDISDMREDHVFEHSNEEDDKVKAFYRSLY